MLQNVRKALKGVVAWFVVVLLVLAFAAFGVPELSDLTKQSALKIGKEGFSKVEIQNEFNREVAARRAQNDGGYTREDAINQGLPNQIVANMATRSALTQEARRLGLVMPSELVREVLNTDERFKNPATDKFDADWLARVLQQYDLNLALFRQTVTEDLLRDQLISAVSRGPQTPDIFKEGIALREIERRDLTYVIVTDEMAGIPEEPTPQTLQAYYEENSAAYMAPEMRSFLLLEVTNKSFEDDATISEELIRERYEAGRERLYSTPEKRTLYQLTYPSEAEAIAAAEALRQGGDFEDLAKERGLSLEAATSKDAAKRDLLDPNVAEAAFAADLAAGGVAGPISGLFGFVVLQISDITPAETQSYEDVRDDIRSGMLVSDTRKRVYDVIEQIENEQDAGAGLVSAAEAAGLEARAVGPVDAFSFGPGGEIIADLSGDVLKEAFALNEGDESTAVKFSDDSGYFFVAVTEVQPEAVKPFELVEDTVAGDWRTQERQQRIADAAGQVRTSLAGGATFDDAVAPFNVEPLTATADRGALRVQAFSDVLQNDVFTADQGDVIVGAAGANGATAVVLVTGVSYNPAAINPQASLQLDRILRYQLDQELLDAYVGAVREDLGVKTNQAAIDSIFTDG